ncbi:alpha/beta hydrolase [Mesorhizobium sp.]|uniref:alpha/beta hydrolase n=1 Tax=Mesorhizobium sp. TaxID=1871066 RepID=UPI000FE3A775|nr:alpha/beta hydrolase [Mesorhizobium sp.]RWG80774.1 MAG: alpha/beta hydrolase [Mesorhizobium sp.]RWG86050.1 MAG: alpha/beta hydrolase [Mesorhizobium sp.]RWK04364.1 MAG: alpha/beta hydrolase [Mesorhizobium sp.]RWK07987.1 MAG: alpha/beta hydrolase [Mesorhizobium sp.]RWK17502.1 MAG: alpha/beta hydrolase [Mesorhizobium sp.]
MIGDPGDPARRGKYAALLDAELWDYIDKINSCYPPEIVAAPIAEQRAVYDRMCIAFHQGRPEGVTTSDSLVATAAHAVPVRRYRMAGKGATAIVVYYHGGGFVLGDLDSHDDICAEICAGTGFEVVSTDYRLAPEYLHPASFNDALAVFEWVAATSTLPIVLCGESAGGNLAAAVAQATRHHPRHASGQMLIYPDLGGHETSRSHVEHAEAPLLTLADIGFYRRIRSAPGQSADDPTFSPLKDGDFSGLPSTVVVTAECDPLSSDGEAYRDRILAAGGRAWWREEPRLVHSFLRARPTVPCAAAAFARIVGDIARLGASDEAPISPLVEVEERSA